MFSPTKRSGRPGLRDVVEPPSTLERSRRGRNIEGIGAQPTPPRSQTTSHMPTPDSARRSRKRPEKVSDVESTEAPQLPTPVTLPRPQKRQSAAGAKSGIQTRSPPTPTGHTTFYLSATSAARPEADKVIRKRPGLTFAQQMGLATQAGSSTAAGGSATRAGAGVGMGGARSGAHGKVDQITWGTLRSPLQADSNPFVASELGAAANIASPGTFTLHRPGEHVVKENDFLLASPSRSDRFRSSPSRKSAQLAAATAAFPTPPPTKHAPRISDPFARGQPALTRAEHAAAEKRKKAKEQMMRMMDVEDNVFLARPGEVRRPTRVVDESRPTVLYVFRGARKEFANPFIGSNHHLPESELDPEDDDFEPHPCPPPKLLWPSGPSQGQGSLYDKADASPLSSPVGTPKARGRFVARDKGVTPEPSGPKNVFSEDEEVYGTEQDDEDDEEEPRVRRGLLFGPGAMKRGLSLENATERCSKKARRGYQ